MKEHGYFHASVGYWQTIDTPTAEMLKTYPKGYKEIPLKPDGYHDWDGKKWVAADTPHFEYAIPKALPFVRMTEDEAVAMASAMEKAPSRTKMIFDASTTISTREPLWELLESMLVDEFGPARTKQLLAPPQS